MLCREVQNYIATAKGLPFFYVVGDEDYLSVLEELKQANIAVVRMSDFCLKADKFPSVDELVDYFRTSDVNHKENKFVVVGLGEYLALKGAAFAEKELGKLKNTTLGNARAILLLRGVSAEAEKVIRTDNKMMAQQRAYVSSNRYTGLAITVMQKIPGVNVKEGIKDLLKAMEDGAKNTVYVNTSMLLDDTLLPLRKLTGAHALIKLLFEDFTLGLELGTEEQWQRLLQEAQKFGNDINAIFKEYGIDENILDDLNNALSGKSFSSWLVFLYLKLNVGKLQNTYLKFAVDATTDFEELKTNIIVKITAVSHKEVRFRRMYDERKKLLKDFSESDIAVFIKENEVDPEESIYRLTDNTELEKKTVIKWIAQHGMCEAITYVYPALHSYLEKYKFNCPVLADELTEYFEAYKLLKVTNHVSDGFLGLVEKHATEITYAQLPTRDNAIKEVAHKENAYLYWIDALGVEYLAYISDLAGKMGLSMHASIVRSELPTITSINKQFFDQWTGKYKYKEEELDNIKHKEKGGYFFDKEEAPIHIPAELNVIKKAMETAKMELGMHHCKAFVIASDHGATRLAVLKKQEVPYDTDTKGEHSGRCCKAFDGCDVPYKFEENGFIVLADYGRFRGSRAANVEVHGGASLEEIVVPVITLTLNKQIKVKITVLNPERIIADHKSGTPLDLYISDVDLTKGVRVEVGDKSYPGEAIDDTHFTFKLKDIKRAKQYEADVFEGEDLIGKITFKVKGKAAKIKDDFGFDNEF